MNKTKFVICALGLIASGLSLNTFATQTSIIPRTKINHSAKNKNNSSTQSIYEEKDYKKILIQNTRKPQIFPQNNYQEYLQIKSDYSSSDAKTAQGISKQLGLVMIKINEKTTTSQLDT